MFDSKIEKFFSFSVGLFLTAGCGYAIYEGCFAPTDSLLHPNEYMKHHLGSTIGGGIGFTLLTVAGFTLGAMLLVVPFIKSKNNKTSEHSEIEMNENIFTAV